MKPARELLKGGRVSEAKYEPQFVDALLGMQAPVASWIVMTWLHEANSEVSRARARRSQGSIRNDKMSAFAAIRDSRIAMRQSVGISLA